MPQYPSEENPLETALRLAAEDPGCRPDFYKTLLESKVLIIQHTEHPREGERWLEAGAEIAIRHGVSDDGSPIIPFFSSLETLQMSITEDVTYGQLLAKDLFEMTQGADLVLNPQLAYGKEFFADEIAALLSDGVNRVADQRTVEKTTDVLLGQPAQYPQKMVDALVSLFSRRGNVKAAYLVLMHDPSRDDKPHLVVGIVAEHDIESIIREAGTVAADTSPNGESVDLYRIEPGDTGLGQYFIQDAKPFYERGKPGTSRNRPRSGWLSTFKDALRRS